MRIAEGAQSHKGTLASTSHLNPLQSGRSYLPYPRPAMNFRPSSFSSVIIGYFNTISGINILKREENTT